MNAHSTALRAPQSSSAAKVDPPERRPSNDRQASYIVDEVAWRSAGTSVGRDVVVARWTNDEPHAVHKLEATQGCFVIEINLRRAATELHLDGRPFYDGMLPAGAVQMTPPGRVISGRFDSGADLLHIFVPSEQISAIVGTETKPHELAVRPPTFDAVVERLTWSLLRIAELTPSLAKAYGDGISAAIIARVTSREFAHGNNRASGPAGLVKWRLNRVLRFIDVNVSDPISLPDLAECAGLSRMHFAAQFRAATGMRPHDYILRRRVEHAQELLVNTRLSLVEVALSVGFQTQAHFTTVFRGIVADSPGRWRQRILTAGDRKPDASANGQISKAEEAAALPDKADISFFAARDSLISKKDSAFLSLGIE